MDGAQYDVRLAVCFPKMQNFRLRTTVKLTNER